MLAVAIRHIVFRLMPAVLATAILGGCTLLGPDFEEPSTAWLQKWDRQLHGLAGTAEDSETAALQFWWRAFNDPVLNGLIEEARRNNRQLRLAALRILESRALLGIAGSALYPQLQQLGGSATFSESRNLDDPGIGDGSQSHYQAGFNIGWELDFWGRFRRGIESADASFFAAIENQRATQVLVHAQVVELYYAYRVAEARIAIARKNAQIQKRSLAITREQFDSGNASELDVQQANTQYLSTIATLPQLENLKSRARNALAVLLGRPPGDVPELDQDGATLPVIDRTLVRAIPARLLLRRPDLRAALWRAASQSARIGIAEADLYPSLSLFGTLEWSDSSRGPGVVGIAGGPAFKWNIFSYGRLENNVRVQDARFQQLLEQYQDAVLKAAAEADNAAVGLIQTREQIRLLEQTVRSAERALAIANTRYQEGYADFQRVLDAQRSLFTQTDRLIGAQGENIGALIALYKSLGGGWMPMTTEQMLPADTIETMKQRIDWGTVIDAPIPNPPSDGSASMRKVATPPSNPNETP